jgi:DNA-binding HxlR family transcriptional regulator
MHAGSICQTQPMRLERSRFSDENCSIRRTLEIVGERWTLLILREAFFGVRRFDDFVRNVGCPRDVLSARLKTLVANGILERVPYREAGARARHEYQPTPKGQQLVPSLLALMEWGDRWAADADGPAVAVSHAECGEPVDVQLRCAGGHGPLDAGDLRIQPGPGAKLAA